jgi:hypothetical protein
MTCSSLCCSSSITEYPPSPWNPTGVSRPHLQTLTLPQTFVLPSRAEAGRRISAGKLFQIFHKIRISIAANQIFTEEDQRKRRRRTNCRSSFEEEEDEGIIYSL